MRTVFCLTIGICLGLIPFVVQNWPIKKVSTLEENAIAQRIQRELDFYPNNYRMECVLQSLEELKSKQRTPLPDTQLYEIITDLGIKQSEQIAAERLTQANRFIEEISRKKGVVEVVKGFVYTETLEAGIGESISAEDTVLMHFKEYLTNGTLIKDTTTERPFKIPLQQTIRGFKTGLNGAKIGEKRKIYVHPEWGFGKMGQRGTNNALVYEVTILEKIPQIPSNQT